MERASDERLSWLFRVAVALTLDRGRARELVAGVASVVPELGKVSEARLVRSVWERRGDGGAGASGGEGGDWAWVDVPGLGEGEREAGRRLIEAALALDGSERAAVLLRDGAGVEAATQAMAFGERMEAVGQRIARAEERLRAAVGSETFEAGRAEVSEAFGAMRLGADDELIGAVYERAARRRRRALGVSLAALGVFLGLMAFVVWDLLGWDEEQEALDVFSNPMPAERAGENEAPANR